VPRGLDLSQKVSDLHQSNDVQRQQRGMQNQYGPNLEQQAPTDEADVARDGDIPKRHHCPHKKRDEHQYGGEITDHLYEHFLGPPYLDRSLQWSTVARSHPRCHRSRCWSMAVLDAQTIVSRIQEAAPIV
jgi:hypothetical protein